MATDGTPVEDDGLAAWADALEDRRSNEPQGGEPGGVLQGGAQRPFSGAPPSEDMPMGDINRVLDIPVQLSVELGRTRVPIKHILQLGQGSVVELEKLAGEPLDIFINGKPVARGEAVIVNEKFGVRLTDIISPEDRIETLEQAAG